MNSAAYNQLINRIDAFTRRYYKMQLIRGSLLAFLLLIPAWLIFSGAEYFGHFSTTIRTILFWGFIAAAGFSIWKLILIPVSRLYRLGKVISHEEAARMIGLHFSDISDKLLNTLQLKALADTSTSGHALLLAAIDQRIEAMRPVAFAAAVDTSVNRKYLRYAVLPLAALLVVLFAAPSLLFDGSRRLMNHDTYYETPAPFRFVVSNNDLKAVQGDDYTVQVTIEGATVPDEVYIALGKNQFRLDKESRIAFSYTFRNIRKSENFHLLAGGYNSNEYAIDVIPNPTVLNFNVSINYPAYTGRRNEVLSNTGDLTVPAGTKVSWKFNASNASGLAISFSDTSFALAPQKNTFNFARQVYQSTPYAVTASNEFIRGRDSMAYGITVIPDLYPVIQVEQQADSFSTQLMYFKGVIKDDYGFSKLTFNYRFLKKGDGSPADKELKKEVLPLAKGTAQDQFFYSWNMQPMAVSPGSEIEYYFEVWDNDGIHGPKASRSQAMLFKAPSLDELAEKSEEDASKLKDDLQKSLEESRKLQQQLNKAAKDMLQKKELTYDDRKKIEDILKQQKELEKQVEDIRKQNRMNNARDDEYRPNNELAEKKKQLDDLFNKLMSDEMKQLMKELEKMLSEVDKEQMQKMVEDMKLDSKDLEKQLDRTLELFKQLEVEQKMKDAIDKLDRLADEQDKLADKTENQKDSDAQENKDKQKELSDSFDQFKKDMKELEEKNKELEFPQEIGDNKEDMEQISEDMQQSEEQLGQKNSKKASKSQKNASQKMQQLSQKMKQQQQQQEQEQAEEDMASLRGLLENLITFSFDQEQLMQDLKEVNINDPRYITLAQTQRKLKEDAVVIEDSLQALGKRVVQIQATVNAEVAAINDNIDKSILNLQDRLVPQARSNQQYTMTSANNLALLLSEAMDQMQQQMQMQMQGSGNCKKPKSGQGKPSPSSEQMRQAQQKLNEQMKALKKKMEGQKPGDQKGKGKEGQGGMSEELARLAAQQEALRNELQNMSNQENKDGKGSLGDLENIAKQMEETEKDLVNKRLSQETIRRQEEILSRLLESEKAEREREQEERRESNEAKDAIFRNPGQFEEFKKLKMKEIELLQTIPPGMNSFYKNLVNYYFQTLEK